VREERRQINISAAWEVMTAESQWQASHIHCEDNPEYVEAIVCSAPEESERFLRGRIASDMLVRTCSGAPEYTRY